MDNLDREIIIEKYLSSFEGDLCNVMMLCEFLNLDNESEYKELINKSTSILRKKIKKISKCKTEKEVKEHLKLKKLIKKYGDQYE